MIHAFCSIYMYISKSVRDGERPINATFVGANDRKQRNKQKLYKKDVQKRNVVDYTKKKYLRVRCRSHGRIVFILVFLFLQILQNAKKIGRLTVVC